MKKQYKHRKGLKPKFCTLQNLLIAVKKFNCAFPEKSKTIEILFESVKFHELYDSQTDSCCLPDLGRAFNVVWDRFVTDHKNMIVFSNKWEYIERDNRRENKLFSIKIK